MEAKRKIASTSAASRLGPYRPLLKLAGFHQIETREATRWASEVALEHHERPIGVYENTTRDGHDTILFTNRALYVQDGDSWSAVSYKDISGVESPPVEDAEAKFEVDVLRLALKDGTRRELRASAPQCQFPDLWPLLRFLKDIDRVVRWEERRSQTKQP